MGQQWLRTNLASPMQDDLFVRQKESSPSEEKLCISAEKYLLLAAERKNEPGLLVVSARELPGRCC